MQAEFFCSNESAKLAGHLAELIAANIHETVKLEVFNLDKDPEFWRVGLRYQQLLQASIPPERDLWVDLRRLEIFEHRVYVRLYWPILEHFSYERTEGGSVKIFEYTRSWERSYNFFPRKGGLELFLPALAIRDRMILVPEGQDRLLGTIGVLGGIQLRRDVLEVDFGDRAAVDRQLAAFGSALREEVRHELAAYASFPRGGPLDLARAAKHLGVSLQFLERSLDERLEKDTTYARVSCQIEPTRVIKGRWTKVLLRVSNDSDVDLAGLTGTIVGPAEVLPMRIQLVVPAHSQTAYPVSIKTIDAGEFPLEIRLVLSQDELLTSRLPAHHVWLESVEQEVV